MWEDPLFHRLWAEVKNFAVFPVDMFGKFEFQRVLGLSKGTIISMWQHTLTWAWVAIEYLNNRTTHSESGIPLMNWYNYIIVCHWCIPLDKSDNYTTDVLCVCLLFSGTHRFHSSIPSQALKNDAALLRRVERSLVGNGCCRSWGIFFGWMLTESCLSYV